jgi:hypothetical protein
MHRRDAVCRKWEHRLMTISLQQAGTIQVYAGNIETDIENIGTVKAAVAITGTLSKPAKMPCPGYSTPASMCRTGSKLKHVSGSTCYNCYAADDPEWLQQEGRTTSYNNYVYPSCKGGLLRRFESLSAPLWTPAMVLQIRRYASECGYFRWHDSGDIQSVAHLRNIVQICEATPSIAHWIPTREYRDLDNYLSQFGAFPKNTIVRVSAHMVDESAPARFEHSSIVAKDATIKGSHRCPAPDQDKECRTCRACWNPNVRVVAYDIH